jgi:hypothetical protein
LSLPDWFHFSAVKTPDQFGHGLGVNLDVYTFAALNKRQDAVEVLESALARRNPA